MVMCGATTPAWSTVTILPLFLMWAEMMVAMMIPSAAPMILTFAMVNRKRRAQDRPFVSTGLFVSGYLVVWFLFSLVAALAQWTLHGVALLSPMMHSQSRWLAGILLLTAGAFQWTPWKRTCLTQCRSPFTFLLSDWREGRRGAFCMGLKHGAYCTGCCWLLMTLLFVAGVMNLLWIAILTTLVLIEKASPPSWQIGRVVGVLCVIWSGWLLLGS
jgi:predicted metal-binding membrane protein